MNRRQLFGLPIAVAAIMKAPVLEGDPRLRLEEQHIVLYAGKARFSMRLVQAPLKPETVAKLQGILDTLPYGPWRPIAFAKGHPLV
jgi:hypothetical protein